MTFPPLRRLAGPLASLFSFVWISKINSRSGNEAREAEEDWANDMAGEVTEVLYYCAICKTIFEIVRNHIRPPSEPLCDVCQHPLPLAEGDDWLSYRLVRAHPRTQ
jgi:hypothetical protein